MFEALRNKRIQRQADMLEVARSLKLNDNWAPRPWPANGFWKHPKMERFFLRYFLYTWVLAMGTKLPNPYWNSVLFIVVGWLFFMVNEYRLRNALRHEGSAIA